MHVYRFNIEKYSPDTKMSIKFSEVEVHLTDRYDQLVRRLMEEWITSIMNQLYIKNAPGAGGDAAEAKGADGGGDDVAAAAVPTIQIRQSQLINTADTNLVSSGPGDVMKCLKEQVELAKNWLEGDALRVATLNCVNCVIIFCDMQLDMIAEVLEVSSEDLTICCVCINSMSYLSELLMEECDTLCSGMGGEVRMFLASQVEVQSRLCMDGERPRSPTPADALPSTKRAAPHELRPTPHIPRPTFHAPLLIPHASRSTPQLSCRIRCRNAGAGGR